MERAGFLPPDRSDIMEVTSILDYLFIGYGAFFIYEWFLVQIKGRPFSAGIILPQDLTRGTCRDPEGLGRFIAPRLLMEGALLAGFGGFSLLNRRLGAAKLLALFYPLHRLFRHHDRPVCGHRQKGAAVLGGQRGGTLI